jgi:SAM-dependent methyltransferase
VRRGDLHERLRSYWDEDAATYDLAPEHVLQTTTQRAVWSAVLARLLPPPPVRVLDAGAGTGFLSLVLARLGHRVTALDIAPAMLERLRETAAREGLEVDTVEGPAEQPPAGPFDVVVERLLLWTLPNPVAALEAWRGAASGGRLVSFGSIWGPGYGLESIRERARNRLHRSRRPVPEHHAPYDQDLVESLPFRGAAMPPERVVEAVEAAGWRAARLERLRDVESARVEALPPLERLLGVSRQFAVVAEDSG